MGLGLYCWIVENVSRLKSNRMPEGVVNFYLPAYFGRAFDRRELRNFMKKHLAKDVFVVHGAAFKINGNAAIVAGPPASGKSTALKYFSMNSNEHIIDDGFAILVRGNKNKFAVVESGWGAIRCEVADISKKMRKFLPFKNNYFDDNVSDFEFKFADSFFSWLHLLVSVFHLFIMPDRSNGVFRQRVVPLGHFFYIVRPRDHFLPARINGARAEFLGYEKFAELLRSNGVNSRQISRDLLKKELRGLISEA